MADVFTITAISKNAPTDKYESFLGQISIWDDSLDAWKDAGLSDNVNMVWMGDINHREETPADVEEVNKVLQHDCNWTTPIKIPPHRIDINLTGVSDLKLPHCMVTHVVSNGNIIEYPENITIVEDGIILHAENLTGFCRLFILEMNYIVVVPEMVDGLNITVPNHHAVLGIFDTDGKLLPYDYTVQYTKDDTLLKYPLEKVMVREGLVALAPRPLCSLSNNFKLPEKYVAYVNFDVLCPVDLVDHDKWIVRKQQVTIYPNKTSLTYTDKSLLKISEFIVPPWFYNVHHTYHDWIPVEFEETSFSPFTYLNDRRYICGNGGNTSPGASNLLGIYETSADLISEYPTANPNDYASVLETNTLWIWDTVTDSWVDSGIAFSPWEYASNGDIVPADQSKDVTIQENINVGGTVDGRDVSVDGQNLDDHIANASIHTKIETVEVTLDANQMNNKAIGLFNTPQNETDLEFITELGGIMVLGRDYYVDGSAVKWDNKTLDGILNIGDFIIIKYPIV